MICHALLNLKGVGRKAGTCSFSWEEVRKEPGVGELGVGGLGVGGLGVGEQD